MSTQKQSQHADKEAMTERARKQQVHIPDRSEALCPNECQALTQRPHGCGQPLSQPVIQHTHMQLQKHKEAPK